MARAVAKFPAIYRTSHHRESYVSCCGLKVRCDETLGPQLVSQFEDCGTLRGWRLDRSTSLGLEVLLPVQLAVPSLLSECDSSQNDLFLCEVVFVFVFHHSSGKETCVAPEILMEGLCFQISMKYQLLKPYMHCVSYWLPLYPHCFHICRANQLQTRSTKNKTVRSLWSMDR